MPDGNLTGQFVAIAGPAPREIALTEGTGRFRTAVAAHACTALRGHARPPVEMCLAGGKSVAEAASSRTRRRGTPSRRAASAAVTSCGSVLEVMESSPACQGFNLNGLVAGVLKHLGDPLGRLLIDCDVVDEDGRVAVYAMYDRADLCQRFARNCATRNLASLHRSILDGAFHLRCRVVIGGLHSGVNPRRIDGKDGAAGSIPAGGSTTNQQLRLGSLPGLLHA